ncbi:MAG TPA: hypothetical protein DCS97_11095 [Planctomycetes bacterium]|nr:hypothetical protein [Planctomycetota bacterium]
MASSNQTYLGRFVGALFTIGLLVLAAYGIVRWIGVDPGSLRDWVIGLLVLWWLVIVVTLPWDLHFKAREILHDADRSRKDGITVQAADVSYVSRWARWSLWGAIALHLLSAAGLYLLAHYGVSHLGYLAAGAALLLMGLRPAGRAYEYLAERLSHIGREVHHPRDDVLALTQRIATTEKTAEELHGRLDLQERESWAAQLEARLAASSAEVERLRATVEDLRRANDDAHRQLARDAEAAAARMAEDARVLNHVRELVRFFKEA